MQKQNDRFKGRVFAKPLSRRHLLKTTGRTLPAGGALLASGSLAATVSLSQFHRAAPAMAQEGTTLNWARVYKGRTTDPHAFYGLQEMVTLRQVMEPLVDLDQNGGPVPVLAESWSVSEDGRTWTFNLRQNVTFHDGTPFTAEAVQASIARCKGNAESGFAFMFNNYADEPVNIIDDHTIELITKEPEAAFLNNLALFFILPPDAGSNTDMSYTSGMGTGPYVLAEYEIDSIYRYEANGNYWQPDLQRIQSVNLRPILEQSSIAAATQAGELDLVEGLSPDNLMPLRNNPDFTVIEEPSWRLDFLIFNQAGSIPALADPLVRQAMSLAVDRSVITESIMGGTAFPWSTYPPQGLFGATEAFPANPYDLDRAKELMASSSAPDGFQGTIRVPSGFAQGKGGDICQFIAQQLQELGIELEVETGEQTAITGDYRAGAYDIGYLTSTAVTGEATRYLNERYVTDTYKMGYQNPEVNDLIQQISTTIDEQERQALYDQLHPLLWEDTPVLYLFQSNSSFVTRSNVQGLSVTPNQVYQVSGITKS